MIFEELSLRNLPEVLRYENGQNVIDKEAWQSRRLEIIELLSREIYGFSPAAPERIEARVIEIDEKAFASKAVHKKVSISFDTPGGEFSFPVDIIIPKGEAPRPLFLNISFYPEIANVFCPIEEIIDNGFAVASLYYQDIAKDSLEKIETGLPSMYKRPEDSSASWGKLSMWAWAASRVMDYLQTLSEIDKQRIAVMGHSRLGKTALWCGAQDERFKMVIANNSGCSGASLARGNSGERISNITTNFSYWFCENYFKYSNNEDKMPFDQHFLLSLIAPRKVCIGNAEGDLWADAKSEFLSCLATNPVYELFFRKGLVIEDKYPNSGESLYDGNILYHLRKGTHYLSRYDWGQYMKAMQSI